MISKSITKITSEDFQSLIDNGVIESRTIEYKQIISLKSDGDKKEFLADISSFANASGGDLIFGISENKETKLPDEIIGISIEKIDETLLQIDSLIRDSIAPRIAGIQIQKFETPDKRAILLIRIPKSWASPHQVIFKGSNKFYSRSSNGKYLLDIDELRAAFLLGDTISNKIRNFITERVANITVDETPVPLMPYGKIVLHLVPVSSFTTNKNFDILNAKSIITSIRPLNGGSRTPRYNLDGLISSSLSISQTGNESYVQLFRNGIIETANANILMPFQNTLWIPASDGFNYEYFIIEILREYIELYKKLNVDLPIFIFLSLIGVKGYKISSTAANSLYNERTGINKDIFTLPEAVINNIDDNLPLLIKPLFDTIWNACGFERSNNYDEGGQWKPKI